MFVQRVIKPLVQMARSQRHRPHCAAPAPWVQYPTTPMALPRARRAPSATIRAAQARPVALRVPSASIRILLGRVRVWLAPMEAIQLVQMPQVSFSTLNRLRRIVWRAQLASIVTQSTTRAPVILALSGHTRTPQALRAAHLAQLALSLLLWAAINYQTA